MPITLPSHTWTTYCKEIIPKQPVMTDIKYRLKEYWNEEKEEIT